MRRVLSALVAGVAALLLSAPAHAATEVLTLEDVPLGDNVSASGLRTSLLGYGVFPISGLHIVEGTQGHALQLGTLGNFGTIAFNGPPIAPFVDPLDLPALPPLWVYGIASFDVYFVDDDFGAHTPRLNGQLVAADTWYTISTKPGVETYLRGSAVLFDNFRIGVRDISDFVPEPQTWALLLLGFGAVGAALRSRGSPESSTQRRQG